MCSRVVERRVEGTPVKSNPAPQSPSGGQLPRAWSAQPRRRVRRLVDEAWLVRNGGDVTRKEWTELQRLNSLRSSFPQVIYRNPGYTSSVMQLGLNLTDAAVSCICALSAALSPKVSLSSTSLLVASLVPDVLFFSLLSSRDQGCLDDSSSSTELPNALFCSSRTGFC